MTFTYRMTPSEYERYLSERDALADDVSFRQSAMRLVVIADGKWILDGTHARAAYDSGFYWVRTARPVTWL